MNNIHGRSLPTSIYRSEQSYTCQSTSRLCIYGPSKTNNLSSVNSIRSRQLRGFNNARTCGRLINASHRSHVVFNNTYVSHVFIYTRVRLTDLLTTQKIQSNVVRAVGKANTICFPANERGMRSVCERGPCLPVIIQYCGHSNVPENTVAFKYTSTYVCLATDHFHLHPVAMQIPYRLCVCELEHATQNTVYCVRACTFYRFPRLVTQHAFSREAAIKQMFAERKFFLILNSKLVRPRHIYRVYRRV